MVSAFFEKKLLFSNSALMDFQGGPGRVPRRAFGPSEISKEALGKVNQVQGGPFWRVLDRQKFARADFLIEELGSF